MKNLWDNIGPNTKRLGVTIIGFITIFSLAALFSTEEQEERLQTNSDSIRHIITDTNTREVGIDSLSVDVKMVMSENQELSRELSRLKESFERKSTQESANTELTRQLAKLQEELLQLKESNKTLANQINNVPKREKPNIVDEILPENTVIPAACNNNPENIFEYANIPETVNATDRPHSNSKETITKTLKIMSFSSKNNSLDQDEPTLEEEAFLPAGTIITGVLINGMDAPTSQGARQDPFPSMLRVQKEAILPNQFRADIKECFMIVSGYGDLSSERTYLRGETLSCVKDNGDVIETTIKSYAVGEDGKAGVRGRLVSKQGQIIAKSLMAGFLSGAAEAFDVKTVPTLTLDNNGKTQYQRNDFTSTLAQGAAAKGANSALERIAQFYIEMAESIFPVIEIDAGRQVEVILTQGSTLNTRPSSIKKS